MAPLVGQTIQIAQFSSPSDTVDGLEFEDCVISGPAVLIPVECRFIECTFEGDLTSLIWEIPPTRTSVLGAVVLRSCGFTRCRFTRIGMGLVPPAAQQFRAQFDETLTSDEATSGASVPIGG